MLSATEIKELLDWAYDRGALKVKIGDIDILFPVRALPQDFEEVGSQDAQGAETKAAPPVHRNPLDDPDFYASETDAWYYYNPPKA